jgi:hypothetical protein
MIYPVFVLLTWRVMADASGLLSVEIPAQAPLIAPAMKDAFQILVVASRAAAIHSAFPYVWPRLVFHSPWHLEQSCGMEKRVLEYHLNQATVM